jgi:hypothetical protein
MSFMRGPMTRTEIQRALGKGGVEGEGDIAPAEARPVEAPPPEAQQES